MPLPPEIAFQNHIGDYLVRVRKYGVLDRSEVTDPETVIAEDAAVAEDPE